MNKTVFFNKLAVSLSGSLIFAKKLECFLRKVNIKYSIATNHFICIKAATYFDL